MSYRKYIKDNKKMRRYSLPTKKQAKALAKFARIKYKLKVNSPVKSKDGRYYIYVKKPRKHKPRKK